MPDAQQFNPWSTETGLLDNYEGEIVEAWFAVDVNYNPEALLLHWRLRTSDPETPEVTEKFGCGKQWETQDGGKTARRVDGRGDKGFNQNSNYGKIIDRVTGQSPDYKDAFAGALDVIKARGKTPFVADVWTGMKFAFKRETFEYGGEIGTRTRVMPVAYLGEGSGATTSSSPATSASSSTSNGGGTGSSGNGQVDREATRGQLVTLARVSSTHDDFVASAMKLRGVAEDDELLEQVLDQSAVGLYSKAHA